MPRKTATKTPDDDSERCPNCGYCPHCGQSTKPPQIIREVVPRPITIPWRREVEGPYWSYSASATYRRPENQASINTAEVWGQIRSSIDEKGEI